MQRIKEFFKRPATIAVLALTALYVVCMGSIFWGTWSLDKAPVEPDNPIFYPVNEAAQWFQALVAGHDFVPSDLMHVLGGMYFWQELQYALAGYLAALGLMFYLRGRGLSHFAAAAGGGAYGLMGYTFTLFSAGHLGWFIWMMYGPFAFGLADRAVRKGKWRNWALLGAVLAWGAARQPDMWLLFTALTFAYGVWTLVREWRKIKIPRVLAGVCVTAVVACAIGLPQFKRALTQDVAGREAQIAEAKGKGADATVEKSDEERWRFCTNWSLPPEDTAEFVVAEIHGSSNDEEVSPTNPYRGRLGQQDDKGGWHPYRQHSLYFGFLTVLFAVLGVMGWWRFRKDGSGLWRDVPFWFGAGIIVYLCALGCFTPFYRVVYALPFGSLLRAPVKFVHLLEFCVAALSGFGFEAAWRGLRQNRSASIGTKVILVVLAVVNVANLAFVDAKYCAVEDVSFTRLPNAVAEDVLVADGNDLSKSKVFVLADSWRKGALIRDSLGTHLVEAVFPSKAQPISYQGQVFIVNMKKQPEVYDPLIDNTVLRWLFMALNENLGAVLHRNEKLANAYFEFNQNGKNAVIWLPQDLNNRYVLVDTKLNKRNRHVQIALNTLLREKKLKRIGTYSISVTQGITSTNSSNPELVLYERTDVPDLPPKEEPQPDRGRQILILVSVLATFGMLVWGVCGAIRRRKGVNA